MALGGPSTKILARFPVIKTTYSGALDVASLADGVGATSAITVTGAALGDYTIASLAVDVAGITVTSYVSATDTVSVRFQNESGGTLDLASATLRILVLDAGSGL
jgi:hypothetical protein